MQDEVTISISFARVEEFRYLGTNLTYQNSIQEEIKSRLQSGNACTGSFVFQFAVQKYKVKDIQNYNVSCFLYECETWSFILSEKRKLRVFENRVLRRIFGLKRDEVKREWRRRHIDELNELYSSPNVIQAINLRRMRWARHVACMSRDAHRILQGNLRERDYLEDPGVDGRIIQWRPLIIIADNVINRLLLSKSVVPKHSI